MKVIPKVNSHKKTSGVFVFSQNTAINSQDSTVNVLLRCDKLSFGAKAGSPPNSVDFVENAALGGEEYNLDISENKITVGFSTQNGILRALSTLKQLIDGNFVGAACEIPCGTISDKPRFSYRGYMLDVARHFFGVPTVKKILDAMWLLKLNVLHLHLCDNQGFRLQIDALPKLHEIGSKRAQTRGDGVPVEGYYTKADIAEIISYAKARGIEVIPEIDLPGHTIAILAAYPELSCKGEPIKVSERFGITREILCAGKKSVLDFVFKLLSEVAAMFPSQYIHIGGDEAPKFQWEECGDCKRAVQENGLRDMEDLQGWFTNRIIEHLKTLGKTAIVWNESLNSGILDKSAICQYWQDGKVPRRVFAAADGGRKVIVSKFSPYYLDYPYGMFSLKKTYLFEPLMDGFSGEGARNIIGVESPLWTEYVASEDRLFYQTFPRLAAVAESGWHCGAKDFADFKVRYPYFQNSLAAIGVRGASLRESLPNPVKGALKVAKFALHALDKELIKSALNAKKVKENRRTE
jgi:hexosaminidase